MPAKRIVYLFGAGATIAEAQFAGIDKDLSLRSVSEMVIKKAKSRPDTKDLLENISTDDIIDIERYISLLEDMQIQKYRDLAVKLRNMFCECIRSNLRQNGRLIEPSLTMALMQIHRIEEVNRFEELKGVITLNYDSLLDHTFNRVFGSVNYGVSCDCVCGTYTISEEILPLIKLHGSFNWRRGFPQIIVDEDYTNGQEEMIWIPPGIEKEKGRYPFNLLWGNAYELLSCDVLRIIGCSLSLNDWGLTSLLFRTQLRGDPEDRYIIEIINSHEIGEQIRKENGYLGSVKALGELENCQDFVEFRPVNIFESWLKMKASSFIEEGIQLTGKGTHLDKVIGE